MEVDLIGIEARLDELTTQILVPLRGDKVLDRGRMAELMSPVEELRAARSELDTIPARLAGKLLVVFTQMLTEADYSPDPEPLLRTAWNYGDLVQRFLLGRS